MSTPRRRWDDYNSENSDTSDYTPTPKNAWKSLVNARGSLILNKIDQRKSIINENKSIGRNSH